MTNLILIALLLSNLLIAYLIFKILPQAGQKEILRKVSSPKSEVMEWVEPEDETSTASKEVMKELIDRSTS